MGPIQDQRSESPFAHRTIHIYARKGLRNESHRSNIEVQPSCSRKWTHSTDQGRCNAAIVQVRQQTIFNSPLSAKRDRLLYCKYKSVLTVGMPPSEVERQATSLRRVGKRTKGTFGDLFDPSGVCRRRREKRAYTYHSFTTRLKR